MHDIDTIRLTYGGPGLSAGWITDGVPNVLWFSYSIMALRLGDKAPDRHMGLQGWLHTIIGFFP
jgi:hypothetical protein